MVKHRLTSILGTVAGMVMVASFNNGGIEVRADPQTVRADFAYVGLDDSSWIKPPPLPKVEYEVFDKVEGVISDLGNFAVEGKNVVGEALDSIDTAVERAEDVMSNLTLIPPMEGFYLPKEAESRYRLVASHGQKRLLNKANQIQENYGDHLKDMCVKYNVPYDLAFTTLHIESGGNLNAVSKTGVKGIMQITGMTKKHVEKHYKKSGRDEMINCTASPLNNIECGVMLMRMTKNRFDHYGLSEKETWNNVIAAYNRGSFGLARDLKDAGKKHVLDLTEGEVRRETYGYVRKARAYQALLHTNGFFNR
ncbi:transglycosylase SLT domain-containing protein [Candidatus Woesearchaeota archaeon]|jgi:hypothetical protein|nr:transglycosylase SLT domain-containing protein [Candidatus Woesearchaeota archaeon]MBT4150727.1 transglycosylase SLT domain-containing protein [Candidatus Woesearchaeota archaeon]MBT4247521.1 transglycosylase SLT domain-containing protein [Candidatus Woesearchaeota archaeon]MBT4434408.1 transglycosylase SLT domain-containing protein [Candidatus Woesearchaeota archaeon]MBT7331923.1 transglycosylase SLT domain-containing protein [Candidatus Woesearchaeota archaeon]